MTLGLLNHLYNSSYNFFIPSHTLDDTPPAISSLHYHNYNLYVGLVTGEILIIDAIAFSLLTTLHCHRSHVNSFLPIDLAKLLPHPSSPAYTPALSPSHPFLITDDNNVKYKTGPLQLMSFGTGFRYAIL